MLYILYIDTVGPTCSVWVSQNNKKIASASDPQEYRHSAVITTLISSMLEKINLSINQFQAICCYSGPGSYTGLRVGQSVAKAICLVKEIPLMAFSVFDVINHKYQISEKYLLILVRARKNESYYQLFYGEESMSGPGNIFLDSVDFAKICSNYSPRILGSDQLELANIDSPDIEKFVFSEEDMIELALLAFEAKKFQDIYTYSPLYIKPPHITQPKVK